MTMIMSWAYSKLNETRHWEWHQWAMPETLRHCDAHTHTLMHNCSKFKHVVCKRNKLKRMASSNRLTTLVKWANRVKAIESKTNLIKSDKSGIFTWHGMSSEQKKKTNQLHTLYLSFAGAWKFDSEFQVGECLWVFIAHAMPRTTLAIVAKVHFAFDIHKVD